MLGAGYRGVIWPTNRPTDHRYKPLADIGLWLGFDLRGFAGKPLLLYGQALKAAPRPISSAGMGFLA